MNNLRDRPIIFSGPMVRAIIDGRKTKTRRIVCASIEDHPEAWSAFTVGSTVRKYRNTWSISKPDPEGNTWGTPNGAGRATELWRGKCPYGEPGDRLWVRETYADADCMYQGHANDTPGVIAYRADHSAINFRLGKPRQVEADDLASWNFAKLKWRPSIFMPRWASRITLEVARIRIERLQQISESDAQAEGGTPFTRDPEGDRWTDGAHRTAFEYLWQKINGKRASWVVSALASACPAARWQKINGKRASWESNPWVWVVEFTRLT